MYYREWIANNKKPKNDKLNSFEKKIDLCFWIWLCFSSAICIVTLSVLPLLTSEVNIIFVIFGILIALGFIPFYIKQIVLTAKRKNCKPMKSDVPKFSAHLKNVLLMLPNLMMISLLGGLLTLLDDAKIILWIAVICSLSIGIILLSIKALGE